MFRFKQFTIHQDKCAIKVCTDSCLFGAWVSHKVFCEALFETSILDIGAGTGLLSLMLAQKLVAEITAVEIDKDAAIQAAENVNASQWAFRIQVIQGDIRDLDLGNKFDLIVSNPPFFENDLVAGSRQKNVAKHGHGLKLSELIDAIDKNLEPHGTFAIMLPTHRMPAFVELAKSIGRYPNRILNVSQTPKHSFFRSMIIFTEINSVAEESSLTIKDEYDNYSEEFVELLKDYYLYL